MPSGTDSSTVAATDRAVSSRVAGSLDTKVPNTSRSDT